MNDNRQAGKGSKPRPVKGDVYRKNWDRIFRKKKPTPPPVEGVVPPALDNPAPH